MNANTFQLGQVAMQAMEEAILSTFVGGECIGPKEISDRTGIFRGERADGNVEKNDVIVSEMLVKLLDDGRVRRCTQHNKLGGWELVQ